MIMAHIERLKTIFSSKGFSDKKISAMLPNFLTSLEYRLSQIDSFEKKTIEPEDIEKFKFSIKAGANYSKTYQVFNRDHFLEYFLNYSICLIPLETLFEVFISNPYGFKNLIYVSVNKDEDPYSFYVLSRIDQSKRYWKMDCRLDLLTTELSESVKIYGISLFRSIYKKCVNTNNYVQWGTCMGKFQVLEYDCMQLLKNIYLCQDFVKLNDVLRRCVKEYCTKQPTVSDRFDLYTDDKEKLAQMKEFKLSNEDIISIGKTLFDDIDDTSCLDFYKCVLS